MKKKPFQHGSANNLESFQHHVPNSLETPRFSNTPVKLDSGGGGFPTFPDMSRLGWFIDSLSSLEDDASITEWTSEGDATITVNSTAGLGALTYKTDNGSGLPTARLNGSNQMLKNSSAAGLDMTDGLTVFMVVDRASSSLYEGPFSIRADGDAANSPGFVMYWGSTPNDMYAGRLDGTTGRWRALNAPNYSDLNLWAIRMADLPDDEGWYANGSYYADAVVSTTGTPAPPGGLSDFFQLGSGYQDADFRGDIMAVVLYWGADMTAPQVSEVATYINTRLGLGLL